MSNHTVKWPGKMSECKRCSECEEQKHHWIEACPPDGDPICECKHCDATMPMRDETTFIETSEGSHTFYFVCEGCGTQGPLDLEVDRISARIHCPEDCGAVYILWNNSLTEKPDLKCVVCPVFEES